MKLPAGSFRELARYGPIPRGGAVLTGPGKLRFKAIVHVEGIDVRWRASETSMRLGTAIALVDVHLPTTPSLPACVVR